MNTQKINFWLFVLLMFPAISQSSEPIQLTLSYQINPSPPYQMGTGVDVMEPPGIALDIINAAAQELNIKVVYKRYPNVRVMHLLKHGQIDGAFMFSYKPERAKIARYPLTQEGKLDSSKRLATLSYWLYSLTEAKLDWDGTNLTG
ncbi:MAG: transporter substrate-binding domain-containing protein, partial [Marinomonas sp.]